MAKAEILMPFIKSWEGGYVNDQNDRGGATNEGVTIDTFRQVFGKDKTVSDLKNMTDAQWLTVFRKYYWNRWRADNINDQSIANLLVDWVWASGEYGITIPQAVMGVLTDGMVGGKTLGMVNAREPQELFAALWQRRKQFIENICNTRPANRIFYAGWMRRLNGIQYGYLKYNNGIKHYYGKDED